ncbi:16S rRNA (uracil(1498)-N(3))-methyltransferase, partial [candidate division KSB1 bacterium]|nr:16S rRNA (uracil(1498)-N(3))-methyltransferase [candidate division KSB1 bacterium]
MNQLLFSHSDFIDSDRIRVNGKKFDHLVGLLNIQKGGRFRAGLLNGNRGTAVVEGIRRDHLIARVELHESPPPPLSIRLLLALPRPKVLKRVLQGVTSLGIKEVYLFATWKVEKSYWQTPVLGAKGL